MKNKEVSAISKKIKPVLKQRKIKKASIFGSYARGEQNKESDIDILIEAPNKFSLYDLIGLELELKKLLRKKVEVLTYKSVHPLLKKRIQKEEVKIL